MKMLQHLRCLLTAVLGLGALAAPAGTAAAETTTLDAIRARGYLLCGIGEVQADGSIGMRLYHKPLVLLIWIGSLVMAAGGALSLTDRRLRIGAPARAKAAPANAVPAE